MLVFWMNRLNAKTGREWFSLLLHCLSETSRMTGSMIHTQSWSDCDPTIDFSIYYLIYFMCFGEHSSKQKEYPICVLFLFDNRQIKFYPNIIPPLKKSSFMQCYVLLKVYNVSFLTGPPLGSLKLFTENF